MIDNLGLYEMYEREQTRQDRINRKLKIEEEIENERITDNCKSATGKDNNKFCRGQGSFDGADENI
jgi:hypothetical protein